MRLEDLRHLGYCGRGSRKFLAKHGVDWSDFIRDGITIERLEEIGDAMALKVAKHALERNR